MAHNLPDTTALLERTPATVNVLLRSLPESWTSRSRGGGVDSPSRRRDRPSHFPTRKTGSLARVASSSTANPDTLRQIRSLGTSAGECRGKSLPQLLDEILAASAASTNSAPSTCDPNSSLNAAITPRSVPSRCQSSATWAARDLSPPASDLRISAAAIKTRMTLRRFPRRPEIQRPRRSNTNLNAQCSQNSNSSHQRIDSGALRARVRISVMRTPTRPQSRTSAAAYPSTRCPHS